MFPLGTVLFPSAVLPLHVFELRYRALVQDCLAGDRQLGVVLIERGSEVGGGDVRAMAGTVAVIAEAAELPDGRWAVVAVGQRRIAVERWLPDAPYPRAAVRDWPDPPPSGAHEADLAEAVALLRRVLALAAEAGDAAAPATVELAEEPVLRGYQACALAPIGPLDLQSLLVAPDPDERVRRLAAVLTEQAELLELRLGAGGPG
jgi:Lon protease-like protein